MFEVGIVHPVGETLSTNTNTFKYTITSELMHNQVSVHESRGLNLKRGRIRRAL